MEENVEHCMLMNEYIKISKEISNLIDLTGAIEYNMVAKNMMPSKKEWEQLGFVFTDTGHDTLCQATLPIGWSLKVPALLQIADVVDECETQRGKVFFAIDRSETGGFLEVDIDGIGNLNAFSYSSDEELTWMIQPVHGRKIWERSGFTFEDVPIPIDFNCQVTFPEGWNLKRFVSPILNVGIVDKNGIERGSICYGTSLDGAEMSLKCRYHICEKDVGNSKLIYFGNEKEQLFLAGQVPSFRGDACDKIMANEIHQLQVLAEQFADANYPGWKNVAAYWDDYKGYPKSYQKQK